MDDDATQRKQSVTTAAASLAGRMVQQCRRALAATGHRTVRHVYLADPKPGPDRDAEFGLLVLDDGAAGLYYAWLHGDQARLPQRIDADALPGQTADALVARYLADSDSDRSLGLAAINAVTASFWRRAGWEPDDAADSFAGLDPRPGDVIGMIGNFPPLVRRANAGGIPVRVVEQKPHMVTRQRLLEVALDPAVLAGCNKLVCTGATLINHSFERMRAHWPAGATVAVVGPSVSCFPDELFALGADIVAGSLVSDGSAAWQALAAGGRLGDVSRRTLIRRDNYPGFEALLASVSRG